MSAKRESNAMSAKRESNVMSATRESNVMSATGAGSLRAVLEAEQLGVFTRVRVRGQLASPWCWPVEETLASAARAYVASAPPRVEPGVVALLSVGNARSSLYELRPGAAEALAVPLAGTAEDALRRAERFAARDLPVFPNARRLQRGLAWWVRHVGHLGEGVDARLEGHSYELPMALAVASFRLGIAVRPGLVATGRLEADGALGPVTGLAQKLTLVRELALGVTTVLVPHAQRVEADDLRKRLALTAKVVGVVSLADAYQEAFPDLATRLAEHWADPADARRAAHELFRVAVEGSTRVLNWRSVRAAAGRLVERLGVEKDDASRAAAWEATVAEAIAARHRGQVIELVADDAQFARYPEAVRTRLWAHVVQSAADAGDDEARAVLARAVPRLPPPRHRHADDLRLAGAIGRAYGALGRYVEARDVLREACEGWRALHAEHQASHAVGELARVLGLLGDAAAVEELHDGAWRSLLDDPATGALSVAYSVVALARAYVQVGRFDDALAVLDGHDADVDWSCLPPHLSYARFRWRARACDGVGRIDEARALRRRIGKGPQGLLAALDAAVARGGSGASELARLRGHGDVERVIARVSLAQAPRAVADEYRY